VSRQAFGKTQFEKGSKKISSAPQERDGKVRGVVRVVGKATLRETKDSGTESVGKEGKGRQRRKSPKRNILKILGLTGD